MNFLTPQTPGTESKKLKHGTTVGLPGGSTTLTTHSRNLLLPGFPLADCRGEIRPFQQPLISIPQLCKNNLKVTFDKEKATIYAQNGNPVLTGKFFPIKKYLFSPSAHLIPKNSQHKRCNNQPTTLNLNTGQQTKPRHLVPPDLLQPIGNNMDQSDNCRGFFHLAWPHQQAHHKTPAPLSQYCPGPPPSTIPKHPINQTNLGPSPATHPPSKNKQCIFSLPAH